MRKTPFPRVRLPTIAHVALIEAVPHIHVTALNSGAYSFLYLAVIAAGSRATALSVAVLCAAESLTTAYGIPAPPGLYPVLTALAVVALSAIGWDGPAEWFAALSAKRTATLRHLLTTLMALTAAATLWESPPWTANLGFIICLWILRRHWPPQTSHIVVRQAAATFFLFVVSCALSLLLLEEGVRLFFRAEIPAPLSCNVAHPRRIWTLHPNCSGTNRVFDDQRRVDREVAVRISSIGLRERELPEKEPHEFRILLLGDSFVYGYGLRDEDTISRALELALVPERPGSRITAINGGVWAYAPWQSRDLLNETGFKLAPDLVIEVVYTGNDVDDTLARIGSQTRAYYIGGRRARARFVYRAQWNVFAETWLREHFHTLAWSTQRFGWPRDGDIADCFADLRFVHLPPLPSLPPSEDRPVLLEMELASWYPELEQGFGMMMEDVRGMRDDCRSRGIDFLLCAIPPREVVYEEQWQYIVNTGYPDTEYERGKGVRKVEEAASAEGIGCIPLLDHLCEASKATPTYFKYDAHFNETGAALTAMTIAEYLQDHYFVN